jgi:abortive infection bacteriophage resistance protein
MQNKKRYSLKNRDLLDKALSQFTEQPEKKTLNIYLSNLPYYDLIKGYKNTILKNKNNKFIENLSVDILYHIHWLDSSLSNLMLKYSLETEKHLKAELSKIICNYGENYTRYLEPRFYNSRNSSTLRKINEDINKNTKFKNYIEKDGCLPAWYLIQHLSFGRVVNWYSILRDDPKTQITKNFLDNPSRLALPLKDKKELFKSFLNYSLEVRNKSAHGNRILNINIQENINKNHIIKAGLSDYFKFDNKNQVVLSNIVNFIAITIILTSIPNFSMNMLNEFTSFFRVHSQEGNNVLSEINITVYKLFNIDIDDLKRLNELIINRFGLMS